MVQCISVRGCWIDVNETFELLINFLLIDVSEVILAKLVSENGVRTSAVEDIRVAILFIAILRTRDSWGLVRIG
jgi:hypothetical protein